MSTKLIFKKNYQSYIPGEGAAFPLEQASSLSAAGLPTLRIRATWRKPSRGYSRDSYAIGRLRHVCADSRRRRRSAGDHAPPRR
jgi:hypothetical protein